MYRWRCVLFLSAMAATGYCLKCTTCPGLNPDSCSISSTEDCPKGYVCASQQHVTITGNFIFQGFKRFCAPPGECNMTGTFTEPYRAARIATTCCSEDLCTPAKPRLPDQGTQPNGLVCPRCALMSESCESLDTMSCMGEETMCRLVTEKQTTGSQTLTRVDRGCASEGLCYTRTETSTDGAVYKETTYSCTPGTSNKPMSSTTAYTAKTALLFAVQSFILVLQNNLFHF